MCARFPTSRYNRYQCLVQTRIQIQSTVDQLTVNEYQPGIGISSHVDAHSAFEDGIAAVTLGAGVVMEFRKPVRNESGKVWLSGYLETCYSGSAT